MYLEKIRKMKVRIIIAIVAIASLIYVIISVDKTPENITAIATVALVIVTIFLVYANSQLANITENLVYANLQLVQITKNQDKPYLHFYAKQDGSIYIKNAGKGAALNVEYTYNKNGRPEYPIRTWDVLCPNEEFELDIKYPVKDDEDNDMVLTIDARCNDINNELHIQDSIIPYLFS
jgi:phosphoribosylanthranilate isomerase